ncbi:MAG: hypothetical protein COW67_03975 [Flavobacteriales bacterium CG18_big_fil_WC_8_21_14_2_50_32_9]|nr:MAG: hypothetical protein COW67_03975 [Flavobacteriales bacterium CG18_big_fil_WC_8_21_14_2_50_32_9]
MKIIAKIVCLLSIFFLSINSNAQGVNKRYPFVNTIFSAGLNAFENDSGYLMIGGVDSGIASIGIVQTDFEGNVLFQKTIMDTNLAYFAGFQGSLIKVSSGGYAMYGSVATSSWARDKLYRFNSVGDTLWTKTMGDTAFDQVGSQVKETLDGGFVCVGQNTQYSGQNWVVKTDSLGAIEWEQWYGSGVERPTAIALTPDSGYIFTGWTRSLGPGAPNNDNIRITKIDKQGNLQWNRVFGQTDDDNAWSINTTQDGGYIFGGSIRTVNTDSRTKHYAIRLDSQGDTIWTRAYNPPTLANSGLNGFRTIIELSDGNFIAAGQEVYTDSISFSRHDGLIMKLKPNGDILWNKTYRILGMNANGTDFEIKDIRPTNDGGFICGGVVYPSFPDTGTQDMWLMKIDSNGCVDTSNCVIVSSIESHTQLEEEQYTLKAYPNPFVYQLTIVVVLPQESTNAYLVIKDVAGKELCRTKLNSATNQYNIEGKQFSSGIYFYFIEDKEKIILPQKLIKME